MLTTFLEKYPQVGIFASITGFASSFVTFLHALGLVVGLGGAVFGLLAGFYTWRIKKHQWERESAKEIRPRPPNETPSI